MSEHSGTQKHQDMAGALFIIDLARCTGCHACAVACKDRGVRDASGRNIALPDDVDMLWVRSDERGHYPQPDVEPLEVTFRPIHCWHCQDADVAANGCAAVCPVEAIRADGDGHWLIDLDTCVRCGACAEACPFEAIDQLVDGTPVVCDGCIDELARGWEPTCVRACPMRALAYRPYDGAGYSGAGYSGAGYSGAVSSAEEYAGREPDTTWDAHDLRPRVVYLKRRKESQ
jgi:anaerobic dimethyl sulfoxide reductase subunit B